MNVSRRAFLALSSSALVVPAGGLLATPAEAATITLNPLTTLLADVDPYDHTWVTARANRGFMLGTNPYSLGAPQLRYFNGSGGPVSPAIEMPYLRSPIPIENSNGSAFAVFDDDNNMVSGQKFSSAMAKVGTPIALSDDPGYDYVRNARAARLSNGNILCVWRHEIAGGAAQIRSRVVSPDGALLSAETVVMGGGLMDVLHAVPLAGGGAIVSYGYHDAAWNRSERMLRLSNTGARIGTVKVLRKGASSDMDSAGLAPLANGGFVAIWQEEYPAYSRNGRLKGAFFSASMVLQKTFVKALPKGQFQLDDVRVAVNTGGRMLAVCKLQTAPSTTLYRRAFSAAVVLFDLHGNALAGPKLLDSGRHYGPYEKTVTALSDKRFYVTWMRTLTAAWGPVSLVGRRISVT